MEKKEEIRNAVRQHYADVAKGTIGCCGDKPGNSPTTLQLGYPEETLSGVPVESNLGLGCGNPFALAQLMPGQVVLDLGSGAGFDCFLAAQQVSDTGLVIGVDMTPEMISRARENARKVNLQNVEFRLGEIEHLPVADSSIDVAISNCVINLSPDKPQVFREAYRVLKPGGCLAISDIVATGQLPEAIRSDLSLYSSCAAGAASIGELQEMLKEAGFIKVRLTVNEASREFIREWGENLEHYIVSASIEATKL